MGLLDGLVGNLVGSVAGNDPKQANLANSVLSMVTNPQGGGIGGILSAFEAGGLGHLVQSWISTGPTCRSRRSRSSRFSAATRSPRWRRARA